MLAIVERLKNEVWQQVFLETVGEKHCVEGLIVCMDS